MNIASTAPAAETLIVLGVWETVRPLQLTKALYQPKDCLLDPFDSIASE
jgi:hypothetical protein